MTEAPPTAVPGPEAPPEPEKALSRSREGRMITGVCAGLGRHTGMDPVLFRVGFAVLVLASGIGFMLYVAAFLLMRRPEGGPGHLEQWTRRMFDAETVLALLAAVFAFGLIINVASGGINHGTIVVGTLLAIVLMAAHARGVDLLTMARSVPERATGRRGMTRAAPDFAPFTPHPPSEPFSREPSEPLSRQPAGAGVSGTGADGVAGQAPVRETWSSGAARETAVDETATHDPHNQDTRIQDTIAQDMAVDDTAVQDTAVQGTTAHDAEAPGLRASSPPARDGYRRLSDLAREARAGLGIQDQSGAYGRGSARSQRHPAPGHAGGAHGYGWHGYGSGEPFAPHGPYQQREQHRSYGEPYEPGPYRPPAPPPPVRPAKVKRPRSFVSGLTICLALIVGGIMVTMERTGSGSVGLPVVGGAVLVTIGAGLLVAAWFGRGAALVAAGTIVALVLAGSSTVNGMPRTIGSFVWHPTGVITSPKAYELGIGEGKLDLSDVTLTPGVRVRFAASVSMGQLTVIVPPTARVEVRGYAKLGEVRIDHKVEDGADVRFDQVLEPETPGEGDAPTIELHVKAGVGDVEVRRAA